MIADWMLKIRVGDVLESGSGDLRIVRSVTTHKTPYGYRVSVTFVIHRCSWTNRCYTVLTSGDMKNRDYRPTGIRMSLRSKLDKEIFREMKERGKPTITCCDVAGIP